MTRVTPRTLAQWPWVVVRLDCVLCTRKGCYRLARLAARYGPEQGMDGLLRDLAQDCPWFREATRTRMLAALAIAREFMAK